MFLCPNCNISLVKTSALQGVFWRCPACDGRAATISLLRKNMPQNTVNSLWQTAKSGNQPRLRHCPACNHHMAQVSSPGDYSSVHLDVCTVCQSVWFDRGEYEALPAIPKKPTFEEQLPQKAREQLALLEIEAIREKAGDTDWGQDSPNAWWQWIPAVFGMPVEYDSEQSSQLPLITWGLALLIFTVSVASFVDIEHWIQTFGLIPSQFERYGGVTFVTSFFLHGGVFHLLSNLYFLVVFGDNVEDWLGKRRYILLLSCSAIVGDIAHIILDPHSNLPCVGASGGISGIITYYALKFPRAKLGLLVRIYVSFRWIRLPAYAMFIIWIAMQFFGAWRQVAGFSNVSALAHLGGASTGVIFWLLTRKDA